MKKANFFVLSVAALLALGACSGGGNSEKPKPGEYVDPDVKLKDLEKAI